MNSGMGTVCEQSKPLSGPYPRLPVEWLSGNANSRSLSRGEDHLNVSSALHLKLDVQDNRSLRVYLVKRLLHDIETHPGPQPCSFCARSMRNYHMADQVFALTYIDPLDHAKLKKHMHDVYSMENLAPAYCFPCNMLSYFNGSTTCDECGDNLTYFIHRHECKFLEGEKDHVGVLDYEIWDATDHVEVEGQLQHVYNSYYQWLPYEVSVEIFGFVNMNLPDAIGDWWRTIMSNNDWYYEDGKVVPSWEVHDCWHGQWAHDEPDLEELLEQWEERREAEELEDFNGAWVEDLTQDGDVESNPGPDWIAVTPCPCPRNTHGHHTHQYGKEFHCCSIRRLQGRLWGFDCEWRAWYACESVFVSSFLVQILTKKALEESLSHISCRKCREIIMKEVFLWKKLLKEDYQEDLTTEGIEPNPGPRPTRNQHPRRDRSKMHFLKSQTSVDTRNTWDFETTLQNFTAWLKQNDPQILNIENFPLHASEAVLSTFAGAICGNCSDIFPRAASVLVCKCFRWRTEDETFRDMVKLVWQTHLREKTNKLNSMVSWSPKEPAYGPDSPIHSPTHKSDTPTSNTSSGCSDMFSWESFSLTSSETDIEIDPISPGTTEQSISKIDSTLPLLPTTPLTAPASPQNFSEEDSPTITKSEPIVIQTSTKELSPESSILMPLTNFRYSETMRRFSEGQTLTKRERFALRQEITRKFSALNLEIKPNTDLNSLAPLVTRLPGLASLYCAEQLEAEQATEYAAYWKSFPAEWKWLLTLRHLLYLGEPGIGAFDLLPPFKALCHAWWDCPVFVPQGPGLCVFGWEGLSREMLLENSLIRPGFLDAHEECQHVPRGRSVRYVLGPAPHANGLGFFFNEFWLPEHFSELQAKGFYPTEVYGEFCLYQRANKAVFWTVPSRFSFEKVDRQFGLDGWWSFNNAEQVITLVDSWLTNVFTDGASLSDGSYVSACRRIVASKFSYVQYWNLVVHGSATFFGQRIPDENIYQWTGRCTDSEFRTYVSSWLGNFRIADRLRRALFASRGLRGETHHPINFRPGETEAKYGVEPDLKAEAAREQLIDTVQVVQENVKDAIQETIDQEAKKHERAILEVKMHTREYRDWETDRKSTRLNSSH